ncbi:MAG: Hsp20/alpha crystallin family protein [Alphaproteobacteria bacterium]|nr:Hsp20/alpha crystallin family protein [Alphaproteobacteria bacterium]
MPSNNPGNVEVSVNDNYMTIKWKAEVEKSAGDTADGYHMWSAATSHRTVMLPPNADAEGAKALIKDGTLEIIMPKRQDHDQNSRIIQVRQEN